MRRSNIGIGSAITSDRYSCRQDRISADQEASTAECSITNTMEPCASLCGQRARRMHSFYASQQLCDVTLRCGEKQIHAHRIVLAAACDYFDRMFNGSLKEAGQREIQIDGIEPEALVELVSYCYTGQVRLEKSTVEAMLSGACFLRLDDVIERCTVFMRSQMDASNCLGIRSFADSRGCVKLHQSAHEYTTEHFMEVIQQPEYLSLPLDDVLALLSSDDLNVLSESSVFQAALEWLKHDSQERRLFASQLLSVVRLPCLSPEFLTDFVDTNPLFHEDSDCQSLLKEAMKFHLLPDRRTAMNLGDAARPRKSTVGTLYVIGGMDPNKGTLTIERYDTLKNQWHEAGRMPARRLQFGVAVLSGMLHLVGGRDGLKTLNTFECWEPVTNTWTQLPPINTPRHGLGVVVLEGVIYAIGGHDGWSYLSTAERYDPHTKTWTHIGDMSQARNTVGVAVLNGRIYAIGGRDSGQCLRTVEYYNPHTNKWTQCAPMAKRRGFVGVGVLNGVIYAVGGLDTPACYPTSTRLCCVERYDPKADTWTMVANLHLGRDGVCVCPLGNLLFAVGGYSGSSYLQLVECYDPASNEWREAGSLKNGRAAACLAVIPRHNERTQTNGIL